MKYLVALAAIVLLGAVPTVMAQAPSSSPPTDAGEQSALVVACSFLSVLLVAEGWDVKSCRRHAPDQYVGHQATITTRVVVSAAGVRDALILESRLMHSPWSFQFAQTK